MGTQYGFPACLANQKFCLAITVFKIFDTEHVVLPNPESAQRLGYGIWLRTSACSGFTLSEIDGDEGGRQANIPYQSCKICLVAIKYRHTLFSDHTKIQADLKDVSTFQQCTKI